MGRVHSRRSNRHTGHSQSDHPRPLAQEAFDLRGRNMPLYCVAIHDGSMARHHASGNTVLPLISRGVIHFLDFDGEAPAGRRLEDCDQRAG